MQDIYIFEDSQQSTAGGGQRVSAALIDYLSIKDDVQLTVFDTNNVQESFFRRWKNVALRKYWRPKLPAAGVGSSFTYSTGQLLVITAASILSGLKLLFEMLFQASPQRYIFYCSTKFGFFVALLPSLFFSSRLVMHIHNIADRNLASNLFEWLIKIAASDVVCVSQTVYDSVSHPCKSLIRNPVPKAYENRQYTASDRLSIGVVASFFPYKGHLFFLEEARGLVKKYPKISIHLYGDGPELPALKSRFMSNSIFFHGRFDNLDAIYLSVDIVVIPSIRPEAFSMVIPEAWSYGCLVLASNVPAHAELIDDGINGYLFTPGNGNSLACKLETIIQNWSEQQLRIAAGYTSLSQLGEDNFAHKLSLILLKSP